MCSLWLLDCISVFQNVNSYSFQQKQLYLYSIGCSKPGVYGMECDIPCPNNCRYKTCHIKNGTCFGCVAGYMGTFCKTGMFCSFLSLGKSSDGYYFYVYLQKTILSHLRHLAFHLRSASDVVCRSFSVNNLFSKTSGKSLPKLGTVYVE